MNSATATSETMAVNAGAGRSSPMASPTVAPVGADGIRGRERRDAVHNISNDSADTPRIVICTINNGQIGFGLPFQFLSFHSS